MVTLIGAKLVALVHRPQRVIGRVWTRMCLFVRGKQRQTAF